VVKGQRAAVLAAALEARAGLTEQLLVVRAISSQHRLAKRPFELVRGCPQLPRERGIFPPRRGNREHAQAPGSRYPVADLPCDGEPLTAEGFGLREIAGFERELGQAQEVVLELPR